MAARLIHVRTAPAKSSSTNSTTCAFPSSLSITFGSARRPISGLMDPCPRHHMAGTTSQQRSILPADQQGTLFCRTHASRRKQCSPASGYQPGVCRTANSLAPIRKKTSMEKVNVDGPWPTIFELDLGEAARLQTPSGSTVVRLVDVTHHTEPDYWTDVSPKHQIVVAATVVVEIDGKVLTLICRPAELPVSVGGLRIFVETTYEWAHSASQFRPLRDVQRAVRFSVVEKGASWGPPDLTFPIRNYQWRSSTYQNTWGALVPFNNYYYHRGEDLGAIPDRLPVVAMDRAVVTHAPIRGEVAGSNQVVLDLGGDVALRYAHINIDSILPGIVPGAPLSKGEQIGLTGETNDGGKTQHDDPHLHVDLRIGGSPVSPYPAFIESYFRTYPDQVLAVAGGFGYALVGDDYRLDGTRSVARPGAMIADYEWRLHDGQRTRGPIANVRYERPGYYAEELIVRTADGTEDRDALSVRVYEPTINKNVARGWAHYSPSRDIVPGTVIDFWSRLRDVTDVTIDFGDGTTSPISANGAATHSYQTPGLYLVTIEGAGSEGEPAALKLRVRVNDGDH